MTFRELICELMASCRSLDDPVVLQTKRYVTRFDVELVQLEPEQPAGFSSNLPSPSQLQSGSRAGVGPHPRVREGTKASTLLTRDQLVGVRAEANSLKDPETARRAREARTLEKAAAALGLDEDAALKVLNDYVALARSMKSFSD